MPDFRLPSLNVAERFYRACLYLYPASFRRTFARDLVETFRDERRAAAHSGATALAFWMETLRDVATQGLAERVAAMTRALTRRDPAEESPKAARTRDERRRVLVQGSLQDLRYGVRALRRAPAFTFVALLTLSLCIGATTAVFSVVRGVLIKPLPFPDAEALVSLKHTSLDNPGAPVGMSGSLLTTYARENHSFRHIGVWSRSTENVTEDVLPEEVTGLNVSVGTLPALGVQPALGRWFSEADDSPGSPETVILMEDYWRRRFGGDPSIIGRHVTISARQRAVVGVMPASFRFLNETPDIILPLRLEVGSLTLGWFSYEGLARLAPGVTLEQASADLRRVLPIWLNAWPSLPGTDRSAFVKAGMAPLVRPLKQELVGSVDTTLWVLMGTVGIVLLMACANVASLVLVRAEGRHHELVTRAALGATRARLAREMLLESFVLGIVGGALGLSLASAGLRVLVAIGPATIPRLREITLDPIVVIFTIVISIVSASIFGGIPVVKYTGRSIAFALRSGGRSSSDSRDRRRTRNTLVVAQVALALILMVGAGLMVRTSLALRAVPPGFTDPQHVQLVRVTIPEAHVGDPEQVVRLQRAMRDGLANMQGVSDVSFTGNVPMAGERSRSTIYYQDDPAGEADAPSPLRWYRYVAPGLFRTIGTPLVAGRDFTWADVDERRPVVVVSKNLAREVWRRPEAAVGKRIREGSGSPWREIVGVVDDVYDNGLDQQAPSIVYWPWVMESFFGQSVNVRRSVTFTLRTTRAGTAGLLTEARAAIRAVDTELPLTRVRTLGDVYDRSLTVTSFTVSMLAIAAGMALFLGVVGIYGVIAYTVTQRRREIGIRVALGAPQSEVKLMFVRQGMALGLIGVTLGVVGAIMVTRLMASLLFGTSAIDPMTYGVVSLGLVAIAAVASYVPAHAATTIDPVLALRGD